MFRLIREQKAKVTKVLSANVKSSTSNGYVLIQSVIFCLDSVIASIFQTYNDAKVRK